MAIAGPDGQIDLGNGKTSALLAYLALAKGRAVSRDKIGELLWGSAFEEQSRQSVRQALSRLRKLLGADIFGEDGSMVALNSGIFSCDAVEFEALLQSGAGADLRTAVSMAQGELFEGCEVVEAGFADWLEHERRRLAELVVDAALRLGQAELAQGAADKALRQADDILRKDPLSEAAHRLRLSALDALGRRADALRLHEEFGLKLQRELNTKPDPDTAALVVALRSRDERKHIEQQNQRASIAVMPFANPSGNQEEDYFADGMVDEIITALSRAKGLLVSSRTATFPFKHQAVNASQAGLALHVAYVLEGSVRRWSNRLRITCQLVDVGTGVALWAERFEGELDAIFDLQDQVTSRVVASVVPTVQQAELDRSRNKPTANLNAYDCYLRGLAEVHRWTREANHAALRHFYRAIELDRQFGAAYGMAARCFSQRKTSNWSDDPEQDKAEAEGLAMLAIQFGRDDPTALASAGIVLAFVLNRLSEGGDLVDRALTLNANSPTAWLWSGWIRAWSGEPDDAIARVRKAMALSPNDPQLNSMRRAIAFAHFIAGRYQLAISEAEAVTSGPQNAFAATASVAASAALLGDLPLARSAMEKLRLAEPRLRVSTLSDRFPLRREDDLRRFGGGLSIAGLPD